jgi:hypothetical protein
MGSFGSRGGLALHRQKKNAFSPEKERRLDGAAAFIDLRGHAEESAAKVAGGDVRSK